MTELRVPQRFEAIADDRAARPGRLQRPAVRGKFLFVGEEKLWVKGVTYGTFADSPDGPFPAADQVARDFAAMALAGINAVRVYTVPPTWVMDLAEHYGLRVMVGLPWEQHVAFLDEPGLAGRIETRLAEALRPCVGHGALLCYAIGNEIPASVVRWHGKRRTERHLRRLTEMVRRQDPTALVTYVNFPTTEYLELPFVDLLCFNVYLEHRDRLVAYLARLQNLAGERPLVMAEIGLDSRRNGVAAQASALEWQVATAFEQGCAGAFVFAWTDEWHRGGQEIMDWDFGLVGRDRVPKPALTAISQAYALAPIADRKWPRISVVVCSYNGAATIGETLEGLKHVGYPDFEVIVIDDGSTDATAEIASGYDVRLISTPNNGLSHARNLGLRAATGEIVAYTDDDAFPDPHWLKYLALAFLGSKHDAIGGPNIPPLDDNDMAQCVANAPGGPIHVLLEDELAEHIPGCNMAFRRDRLLAIGGFDPQFRVAGDDVDICWRVQEGGGTIGFAAAAMVWHRRRPSLRRYLKQQQGYARAEALLARKWPGKYNATGHSVWHGRLYGRGMMPSLLSVRRLYSGQWGSALFQSVYTPASGVVASLPLMPEYHALIGAATLLGLFGLSWPPLLLFLAAGLGGLALSVAMAVTAARTALFHGRRTAADRLRLKAIVFALQLLQPGARLLGRIRHGIGPWRRRGARLRPVPVPRRRGFWSGRWHSTEARLERIVAHLRSDDIAVAIGGDFDRWDLTVRGSPFGAARCRAMVEEHGLKGQHFRLRAWPVVSPVTALAVVLLAGLATAAAIAGALAAAIALGAGAVLLAMLAYVGCATGMAAWLRAVEACAAAELAG